MSVFAISDLHIRGADDPVYRSLLALLRERAQPGDTVILAGDLFDLFVGCKRVFRDRYAEFFRQASKAGERGVRLHYIEGNHDFLIGRAFRGVPGATVHSHDISLEISGKRFFFAHGDTVNRRDYSYRLLRAIFRSPLMRGFVALMPGRWIEWIGERSSQYSRKRKPELPAALPAGGMEALRKLYRNYAADRIAQGYDYVVMGHCHDLDEMSFIVGGRSGQYVNMGFPPVHGSFLSWAPGDDKIAREKMPGI